MNVRTAVEVLPHAPHTVCHVDHALMKFTVSV